MSSPFPRVKGVAIIAPLALLDGAKWVTCFNYDDPGQFDGTMAIELAATSLGPATHYAANWKATTPGFWWLVSAGSLMANKPQPEWMTDEAYALASAADGAAVVWDVLSLIDSAPDTMPTTVDFDPLQINLIPLAQGKWSEARDALAAVVPALVRVESAA